MALMYELCMPSAGCTPLDMHMKAIRRMKPLWDGVMAALPLVQAAEHWQLTRLHKGMAGFVQAVHLKHVGQQIMANFVSRQLCGAWNAWTDLVQVKQHASDCAFSKPCTQKAIFLARCT